MSEISDLLSRIALHPDCLVRPRTSIPEAPARLVMPDDLLEFYSLCGGVDFFRSTHYKVSILAPEEVLPANPIILGPELARESADDITSTWFLIATDDGGDYLTIDLSRSRLGRCYDSFHEVHGVAGSCTVIAPSFTKLLHRLFDNSGEYWYWLQEGFQSMGDAYSS